MTVNSNCFVTYNLNGTLVISHIFFVELPQLGALNRVFGVLPKDIKPQLTRNESVGVRFSITEYT